ncbi:hypothetical protein CEXT_599161 [Caerostris extrusa]|uniref:Uncharacterized protein n=1 Tax=Caerostris extrusa TaxID=172846 RepID=A0AAV4SB97_CAEEX|nr:hypothetical protein CEXT_599161 [Caerostris extrusa]
MKKKGREGAYGTRPRTLHGANTFRYWRHVVFADEFLICLVAKLPMGKWNCFPALGMTSFGRRIRKRKKNIIYPWKKRYCVIVQSEFCVIVRVHFSRIGVKLFHF